MPFAPKALLILFTLLCATEPLAQTRVPAQSGAGRRNIIPGRFIVTLDDNADPQTVARENGVTPDRIYRTVIKGFAGEISEAARTGLLRDARIRRVEPDVIVTADAIGWGQDRIDQRRLPLDNIYKKNFTGQGVTAYIVDGGINYQHVEFGGRASFGYDAYGGNGSDCAGHGTHVAGTVGGATYGVAPGVSLISVRVMDCTGSGTMSGVIAGLDWIAANLRRPAVVNLSLGGPATQSMDDACNRLLNAGALVVAAAGNENVDACGTSPARTPDILTVGASDQNDARASFSNYGSCVDLFAPGVMIPSAWYSSTTALAYMDGTSSACPAVTGAVALMLQHYPSIAARALRDSITNHSTKGVITNSLTTKNHLLYSLESNDGVAPAPVPVNTPPVAAFTQSCSNLACTFSDRSTDADGSIVAWRWDFGNGITSTAQNPSYSYPTAGTYTVRLTVTDNAGATGSASSLVTVSAPTTTNLAPVARFAQSCSGLACTFTDQSYDNDGTIASWAWDFGNGVTSSSRNPSYSYPSAGTYTVRLTVSDNMGATNTASATVTVSAPAPAPAPSTGITLSVSGSKSRSTHYATLNWSGATTSTVDIYRNNVKIRTVSNTGSYTEAVARGTYTYRVCNAGSSTCSPDRSIAF